MFRETKISCSMFDPWVLLLQLALTVLDMLMVNSSVSGLRFSLQVDSLSFLVGLYSKSPGVTC